MSINKEILSKNWHFLAIFFIKKKAITISKVSILKPSIILSYNHSFSNFKAKILCKTCLYYVYFITKVNKGLNKILFK